MQSRIPRTRSSFPWFAVLGVLSVVTACDAAPDEDDAYLRCLDLEEDEGDDPPAVFLDQNKGGPVINCPECGSHWTVTEGGIVAVYLDGKLGERVLSMASEGTLRRLGWRGSFDSYQPGPAGGYTIAVESLADGNDEPGPDPDGLESAVLRVLFEEGFVDVGLRYVDNEKGAFGTPPSPS